MNEGNPDLCKQKENRAMDPLLTSYIREELSFRTAWTLKGYGKDILGNLCPQIP